MLPCAAGPVRVGSTVPTGPRRAQGAHLVCRVEKESDMGLFDKAKEFVTDPDNLAKAKEQLTDENVDAATDKLKEIAPDKADGAIDALGEKAKDFGQS